MTSFRQIEANRRNAGKSTDPITEEGKQRSRKLGFSRQTAQPQAIAIWSLNYVPPALFL